VGGDELNDYGAPFYLLHDSYPNNYFWYGKGVGIIKIDAY